MPVPVRCLQNCPALVLMARKTVLGHSEGVYLALQFDQLLVVRDLPGMTGQTISGGPRVEGAGNGAPDHGTIDYRSAKVRHLLRFSMTIDTELVVRPFQSRNMELFRVKGTVVASSTAGRHFLSLTQFCHGGRRPIFVVLLPWHTMVADGAIFEDIGVLAVHEADWFIIVAVFINYGAIDQKKTGGVLNRWYDYFLSWQGSFSHGGAFTSSGRRKRP